MGSQAPRLVRKGILCDPQITPQEDLPGSALLGMAVSWEDTEMGGDPPRLKDETYE